MFHPNGKSVVAGLLLWLAASSVAPAAETVIVAADPWCPHTCDPATGKTGYMIEVTQEAFATAGIKTIYEIRPWATAMTEIRAGLIDGIAGLLRDEAPDLPHNRLALGRQVNAFVVRAADGFLLDGLNSLAGRRIGTVKDYSYSPAIDAWLAAHPTQVQSQPGSNAVGDNLKRLLAGEVDVVVDDEAVLRAAIIRLGLLGQTRIAGRMVGGTLHLGFSPNRQNAKDLAATLDQGIAKLRANGRLAEILAAYGLADWE